MCGEFLARLVHIHAIFHWYCTVHCKRMTPREDASITRMCILATLPLSCTVLSLDCMTWELLSLVIITGALF